MWWLNWIPASCVEIGCMVGQCTFHLCTNPMWRGSPTRCMIIQSLHLPIRCHLVVCLLYRRYFVQCLVDLAISACYRFALPKSDAFVYCCVIRMSAIRFTTSRSTWFACSIRCGWWLFTHAWWFIWCEKSLLDVALSIRNYLSVHLMRLALVWFVVCNIVFCAVHIRCGGLSGSERFTYDCLIRLR